MRGMAGTVASATSLPQPSVEPSAIEPESPAIGFPAEQAAPTFELMPLTAGELAKVQASTALAQSGRPQRVAPDKFATPDLLTSLGARPGVHFDFETGVPFISRLAAEREPTPEEKFAAYQQEYGKENVRKNRYGQAVISTTDTKGRPIDVLADPVGLDAGDMATFLAQSPEIAGSIVPLILSRGATLGPGVLKALGTLALTTGGAELAGAAKDMFRRWVEGRDVQLGEVAQRRGTEAGIGMVAGAALGTAAKAATILHSPFNSAGRLQFNAQEAVDYFRDKYGIELEQTAAQKTGSQILQAAEGMEQAKPGSRSAFAKFKAKQLGEINELKRIATGEIPDEEVMGKTVVEGMKEKLTPLEFDIQEAAQAAEKQASETIKTVIGKPVDKVKVGRAVDLGAKARKSGFDLVNDANYSAFYNNPLSTEKIIGGKPLKSAVDDLLKDLPSIEKEISVPVQGANGLPLVDLQGNPVMQQKIQNIPVSTPVRERLEEISRKLEGGKLSINDLKGIRTDVDNAIKTGEAVPGVKEGRLKRYYSALTKAIDDGLNDIGDPQLTAAWEKATDYYKANVGKFEKAGIAELFRDPINAMGPTELVERASRDPDVYAAYKEFFGPNSPQIKGIHQATKDDVFKLGNLGKTVDAQGFISRIDDLDQRSPQLLLDAFGQKQAEALRTQANIMRASQGANLPKDELSAALSSGTLSGDSLRDMLVAQARRDEAYANNLVREISTGTVKPDRIKPTEVVDKLVFRKATQPEDLEGLMDQMKDKGAVLESMRRLTFKKVLDDSTITAGNGERVISANKMEQMLADPNLSKKLQTVLGEGSYEDLTRLKDFLKPMEISSEAFKTAGGLAGGAQISQIVERGALKYVNRAVKNFLLGTLYLSRPMRDLLTNQSLDAEGAALRVNAAIASEPFLHALKDTYTQEAATAAMIDIKGAVDQWIMRDPAAGQQGPTKGTEGIPWNEMLPSDATREEFLRRIKNQ